MAQGHARSVRLGRHQEEGFLSALRAQFYRLRARRGAKKAICAVASSILVAIYHMLRDGTCYQDPGADYFDRNTKDKLAKRLRIRLENLGYDVNLAPKAAA
jgi:transposase